MRVRCFLLLLAIITSVSCVAQDSSGNILVQNVHGQVIDAESKRPLSGVNIVLLSNIQINDISDSEGYYTLRNVPVGRQSFKFIFPEYETRAVSEIFVSSGKQIELNVSLTEDIHELEEVRVSTHKFRSQALNEMATASARSFSVEETRRYAASISDPARMAMNFAGVANNGDLENDIVVRGNSPNGVVWRLEGIEIPNPNHFSELGSTGGSVSMINANTLGTSDFYTGAFPAEIGNALSGAFDLNLRNGNTEAREYIAQVGLLGTELAVEGPFVKGSKSSYLIDYRYSTLALIQDKLKLNGLIPDYQDINFKFNVVTKKLGTFSAFGIGGINKVKTEPEQDSTQWNDDNPNIVLDNHSRTGIVGIEHQKFLKHKAYLKTVLSASYQDANNYADTLTPFDNYHAIPYTASLYKNTAFRGSILYNRKLDERTTFRSGIIFQQLNYSLLRNNFHTGYTDSFDNSGSTQFYEAYTQWKNRISQNVTVTGGVHASYLALNRAYAIEPRASVVYSFGRHQLSLASGFHSKPDIPTYLYSATRGSYPNKDLDLLKAFHLVLGYDVSLPWQMHLKIETYYQYLYHIPVEQDSSTSFSLINAENLSGLYKSKPLISTGKGKNYGVDVVLERSFANDYYFLLTGSVYKSKFTTYKGETYRGHFDRTFQANIVGGKEFYFNAKKHSLAGLNGKLLTSGGQRESPINLAASIAQQKAVYVQGQYYTLQDPYYFRADASLYYKVNNKRTTHTVSLDVQNVTNRRNFSYTYFDLRSSSIKNVLEPGLIPVVSYRIEFH